jgi:hypothetical protein
MKDTTTILAGLLIVILLFSIGYFLWVGIFWLINAVFGLELNIWLGAVLGIILVTVFKK